MFIPDINETTTQSKLLFNSIYRFTDVILFTMGDNSKYIPALVLELYSVLYGMYIYI